MSTPKLFEFRFQCEATLSVSVPSLNIADARKKVLETIHETFELQPDGSAVRTIDIDGGGYKGVLRLAQGADINLSHQQEIPEKS